MTGTPDKPVPKSEAQPNGLDPSVSCWCQPEGPPHSKACPMHESRIKLAELQREAARYRWLREHAYIELECDSPRLPGWTNERFDAAVDARISGTSESRTNAHLAAPRDAARADQGAPDPLATLRTMVEAWDAYWMGGRQQDAAVHFVAVVEQARALARGVETPHKSAPVQKRERPLPELPEAKVMVRDTDDEPEGGGWIVDCDCEGPLSYSLEGGEALYTANQMREYARAAHGVQACPAHHELQPCKQCAAEVDEINGKTPDGAEGRKS